VLLLLLVGAGMSGWRAGLVTRLGGWLGLIAGLGVSVWSVPMALILVEDAGPAVRLVVVLTTFALTVIGVTLLVSSVGRSAGQRLATTWLAPVDRAAGALAGVTLVVLLAWFVLPSAAALPDPVGRQASDAASARLLATVAPAPPDVTAAMRDLLDDGPLPAIIAELEPVRAAGPPPDDVVVPPEVVAQATASTVRVTARGCGARFDGSGVTIAGGLVVTNAHVVAGSDTVELRRTDGAVRSGRVVAFDPSRDLALVAVEDLGLPPLTLATAEPRDEVAVIGYPGGQPDPRVAAARVQQRRTAVGRDIYGATDTERQVLFLAAELRRGDSGAPLIDLQGRVVGIVFAVSPEQASSAYALDRREVDAILAAPRVTGATGRCVAMP
jgi:S1-C subfamily serine protease